MSDLQAFLVMIGLAVAAVVWHVGSLMWWQYKDQRRRDKLKAEIEEIQRG